MGLERGDEMVPALCDLNRRLSIPAGLAEMGVRDEWLPELAEQAVADHRNATNPRPAGVEDYLSLLQEAMG